MRSFEEEAKVIVMIQNEYTGDYIGYCPWCDNIFYLTPGSPKIKYVNSLIYQCSECGEWVQLPKGD